MRALFMTLAILVAVSACGKKAPLRAPDEPEAKTIVQ
ncbi:LPS translocon maturation chaperone LptM [Hyphococcus lacteus]